MKRIFWLWLLLPLFVRGDAVALYEQYRANQDAYFKATDAMLKKRQYREVFQRLDSLYRHGEKPWQTGQFLETLVKQEPQVRQWLEPTRKVIKEKMEEELKQWPPSSKFISLFCELLLALDSPEQIMQTLRELDERNPALIQRMFYRLEVFLIQQKQYDFARKYMANGNFEQYFRRNTGHYAISQQIEMSPMARQVFNDDYALRTRLLLEVMTHFQAPQTESIRERALKSLRQSGYTGNFDKEGNEIK